MVINIHSDKWSYLVNSTILSADYTPARDMKSFFIFTLGRPSAGLNNEAIKVNSFVFVGVLSGK